MIKEKSRAASCIAGTGENLRHKESYPAPDALQDAALDSLDAVRDLETRALSALWHGLPGSYDLCITAALDDAALFAFAWHGEVFRCLMSCALSDFQPSIDGLLEVMRVGFPDSLILRLDQLWTIWFATSSSACLPNWARLIVRAARRRRQVARLHKCLRDRLADPFGDSPRRAAPTPIIALPTTPRRQFSPRALAAVFGGTDHE